MGLAATSAAAGHPCPVPSSPNCVFDNIPTSPLPCNERSLPPVYYNAVRCAGLMIYCFIGSYHLPKVLVASWLRANAPNQPGRRPRGGEDPHGAVASSSRPTLAPTENPFSAKPWTLWSFPKVSFALPSGLVVGFFLFGKGFISASIISRSGHRFHFPQLRNDSLKFAVGKSWQPSPLQLTLPLDLRKSGSSDTPELVCSPRDAPPGSRSVCGRQGRSPGKC